MVLAALPRAIEASLQTDAKGKQAHAQQVDEDYRTTAGKRMLGNDLQRLLVLEPKMVSEFTD